MAWIRLKADWRDRLTVWNLVTLALAVIVIAAETSRHAHPLRFLGLTFGGVFLALCGIGFLFRWHQGRPSN